MPCRRRVHALHVGHRRRAEPRADHRASRAPGLARQLLADRAQAQDAERGAGQVVETRRGQWRAFQPDARVALGEVEERAQDVLRHLHRCVPRAQVSARPFGRSGSASQPSTPAVSACSQRRRGTSRARRRGAEGEHGLAAREQLGASARSPSGTCRLRRAGRVPPARGPAVRRGYAGMQSSTSGRSVAMSGESSPRDREPPAVGAARPLGWRRVARAGPSGKVQAHARARRRRVRPGGRRAHARAGRPRPRGHRHLRHSTPWRARGRSTSPIPPPSSTP